MGTLHLSIRCMQACAAGFCRVWRLLQPGLCQATIVSSKGMSPTRRCSWQPTLGNMHSSSSRDMMPTDLGGRLSIKSTHSWLSSKSTWVQSMPSLEYASCSSLNKCLPKRKRNREFLSGSQ